MKLHSSIIGIALVLAVALTIPAKASDPGVTLIGVGYVSGATLDRSGLAGDPICSLADPTNCLDQATFGGFGSALTYTGFDNVFLAVPDRGPFDGRTDTPFIDRVHFLRLRVDRHAAFPNISTRLLDTRFLKAHGKNLVGASSDFARRFDPEGVALSGDGNFFVSDEYGPYIDEFDRQGRLVRKIPVPEKFLIDNPSGDVDGDGNSLELYPDFNVSGRQANRGMEGLAITPDNRYLVGIMQNALIQDDGLNTATPPGRVGLLNRIVKIDLQNPKKRAKEFVYVVDAISQGRGVNDLLAVNSNEFLAIERDNRSLVPTPPNAPQAPNSKDQLELGH